MKVRLLFAILSIMVVTMFTTVWYMYVPVNTPTAAPAVVVPTTQVTVSTTLVPISSGEYKLTLKARIPEGYHII
jgi:hypothetical protein